MTTADIFNVGKTLVGPPGPNGEPGVVYELRKPDQYEQGRFQRYLEDNAHAAIDRTPSKTEEATDRRHHLVDVEAGLGLYMYEGPYGHAARFTPDGMVKMAEILLKISNEKAAELVRLDFDRIAAEFIGRKTADPKAAALGLSKLGLPSEWTQSAESEPSSSNSSIPPSTDPSTNSSAAATSNSSSSTTSDEAPMG